jgi:rhodanese-related sulfurtransferase
MQMPWRGLASLVALAAVAFPLRAEIVNVGNDEFKQLIGRGLPVVDVRTAGEWRQTGVIKGSQLITLFDEQGQSDPAAWAAAVDRVAPPGKPVVLICRSGNRSGKAAQLLQQRDPQRVIYNVREGMNGWARAGQPVVSIQQNLQQAGVTCSPRC